MTRRNQANDLTIGRPKLVTMDTVQPEPIKWIWPGKIPVGKLALWSGDPGVGKSVVMIDIASRVSRGTPWPDSDAANPPGRVLIAQLEDGDGDTLRPRLDAAGADVSKIVLLKGVEWYDSDSQKPCTRLFSLERDISALDDACEQYADMRLIVIDISDYLGKIDSHKNTEVRRLLGPLAELAARRRVAVVAITHLNKGAGPAMYRSMGSLAFVAVPRAVWGIVKDPAQPSNRLMLPVKCNLSADTTGLSFQIVATDGVPHIAWGAPTKVTIDEVLDSERQPKGGRGAERRQAAEWLRGELAQGPVAVTDLEERATVAQMKWRTVQRAKDDLGLWDVRQGFGPGSRCLWQLPPDNDTNTKYGINGEYGNYEHNKDNTHTIDTIDTIDSTDNVNGLPF
jgi:hypothetical protein